jgi:hypothetical protein
VVEGEGTLVLDAVRFHLGRPDRGPGGGRVCSVFAALAAAPRGASLVRWQRFHGEHGRGGSEWERFLGSLPGAPARLLCDLDDDILPAVERPWPQTDLYLCESHPGGGCGSCSTSAATPAASRPGCSRAGVPEPPGLEALRGGGAQAPD